MDLLYIGFEDLSEILSDSIRFVSHISLLHFITVGVEGTDEFLSGRLIKTLIYTVLAITIYHILIKKIIYQKRKKHH